MTAVVNFRSALTFSKRYSTRSCFPYLLTSSKRLSG